MATPTDLVSFFKVCTNIGNQDDKMNEQELKTPVKLVVRAQTEATTVCSACGCDVTLGKGRTSTRRRLTDTVRRIICQQDTDQLGPTQMEHGLASALDYGAI